MNVSKQYLAKYLSVALLGISLSFPVYAGQDFSSMQMQGVEPITIEVDIDAAAKRLSRAVQFPTISNQDRKDFDTKAFTDYHRFLVESTPSCTRPPGSVVLAPAV